jgi:integrase
LRENGVWEAMYIVSYDKNKIPIYKSICGAKKDDVILLRNKAVDNLNLSKKDNLPPIGMFKELVEKWYKNVKLSVKESTYATYYVKVYNHIIPELGNYSANDITDDIIGTFITDLLKKGLSEKTVTDIFVVVKSIIKYGKLSCDLSKIKIRKGEKCDKNEMRVLNENELSKLTEKLLNNINYIKLGILISLYTGIRIGEICALQWGNIDFENGVIKIRRTMQRIKDIDKSTGKSTKIIITSPKSESSIRDIPIPAEILPYLQSLAVTDASAYVLTGTKQFVEPRTMQNHFKRIIVEIEIVHANYHSTRHSYATRCIEYGVDAKTLSLILGHSHVRITLSLYVHPSLQQKKDAMSKVPFAQTPNIAA